MNDATKAPELLPCPFCGAEMGPHDGMRWVLCVECGAESGRQIDAASAIAAWNRRATPAALAASPEVQALIREAEARGMERAAEIAWDAANAANMSAEDEHQRGLSEAAFHLRHEAEAIARVAVAIRALTTALRGEKEPK